MIGPDAAPGEGPKHASDRGQPLPTRVPVVSGHPLRIGLSLSNEGPIVDTVRLARRAEQLGLHEVWLQESRHGRGMFTVAAQVVAATERLGVGIGIVNPFWRHPSVIAMEGAALDEASGGRVRLGVGAGLWTLRALGEADARTERPLAAMCEAIGIVRAELRGEPVPPCELFAVAADAHLDFEPRRRDIPVYVGAVNRRMLELAGATSDGVQLGAITSPGYTRWAWDRIADGARSAGRDPAQLDLAGDVLLSVSDDGAAARAAVREVLAYYLWRVEGVVIEESGAAPDNVAEVRDAVDKSGVEAGAALVSDHLVDVFAAAGTPDHVAARLVEYVDAGLRGLLAWQVLGPDPDTGVRQLATEVLPRLQTMRPVQPVTAAGGASSKTSSMRSSARSPQPLGQVGIGPVVAGQLIVSWSHRGRVGSEAAFAKLGGVGPIEASSGTVTRHRLDRYGDRQLNRALHTIVLVRMRQGPHHQGLRHSPPGRGQEHPGDQTLPQALRRAQPLPPARDPSPRRRPDRT